MFAFSTRSRPYCGTRRLWIGRDGGNDRDLVLDHDRRCDPDPEPNSYGEFDPDRYDYPSISFDYYDNVDE